jgi:hypothetical protein
MTEVTEAHAPLIQRLARDFGAAWVDENSVAEWTAGGGDAGQVHVPVLHAGDGGDVLAVAEEQQRGPALRAVALGHRVLAVARHHRHGEALRETLHQLGQHGRHVHTLGEAHRVAGQQHDAVAAAGGPFGHAGFIDPAGAEIARQALDQGGVGFCYFCHVVS